MRTLGERLIDLLQVYRVDTVFGIPGVHTVELYRGLATSAIRHVTPRHEQGAGFMADGYARVTGRPGVAFVITGPGLTNIATAMAQAHADSVPMLVISSVNATGRLGLEAGDLHEVRRQGLIAQQCAAFSQTVFTAEQLQAALARAFALFEAGRPRPVHIEIPVDLLSADAAETPIVRPAPLRPACPGPDLVNQAADMLMRAERPLILAGGGVRAGSRKLSQLAERLDAPVVQTTNGRGLMPAGHPLSVPASPTLQAVRDLIGDADAALMIGTEVGPTDYDMYATGAVRFPPAVIRIEIDAEQMRKGVLPTLPLLGGAAETVDALLDAVGHGPQSKSGEGRAEAARRAAYEELGDTSRRDVAFLDRLRRALPETPIVGDSTQAVYAGNLYHEADALGTWFNAATGYGTLGYAVPAAIGAAIAQDSPVVCLAGDGGFQFTLNEIAVAVQERAPVLFVLWNNDGYGEIKSYMVETGVTPVGVDLHNPDFTALGRAYGLRADKAETLDTLDRLVRDFADNPSPTLIEVDEQVARGLAY